MAKCWFIGRVNYSIKKIDFLYKKQGNHLENRGKCDIVEDRIILGFSN